MSPIGQSIAPTPVNDALVRARDRARLLPECLIEAHRIANTVIAGWHGRRQRGIGENFWQFRPFLSGDSVSGIDWRRSARDNHVYIREREWEAAHTIWLWADLSPSMNYRSKLAVASKESRALVIMLAIADIIARSGERIGCPGIMEPRASRNGAELLANALAHSDPAGILPDSTMIRSLSDIVLISDFLDPVEAVMKAILPIARRGIRGHVVEIADPAEEIFPYAGRTEFSDPESGMRLTAGRPEGLKEEYRLAYLARRETLNRELRRLGWNFIVHHTDRLASEALVALHTHLSVSRGPVRAGGRS